MSIFWLRPALAAAIRGGQKWRFFDSFGSVRPEWQLLPSGAAVDVDSGALRGATLVANGYELVNNGNFETGDPPTGWSAVDSGVLSAVADERTGGSGAKALAVVNGAAKAGSGHQGKTTVIGMQYALTGWAKRVNTIQTVLRALDADGVVLAVVGTATNWEQLSGTFVARYTTTYVRVTCNSLVTGAEARFDDVSLQMQTAIPHIIAPTPNTQLTAVLPIPASGVVPVSLWLRGVDALNALELRVTPNTAGNDCRLIQWSGGAQTELAVADVDWTAGDVDQIRIACQGTDVGVDVMKAGAGSWSTIINEAGVTAGQTNRAFGVQLFDTGVGRVNRFVLEAA